MESELVFGIPVGLLMLVTFARRPIGGLGGPIKERRKKQRRHDQRTAGFRGQESTSKSCEADENRQDDRRDYSKEKRRYERRALERIKRL